MENRRHDARVVDGVGAGEKAALAVFEPLREDLIAADLVGPEVGGDAIEVLGGIDADASAVGVVFDIGDGAIALAAEMADGVVEAGRAHQVQVNELLTKVRQLEKGVTILGERNAREVSLEEFHVASSIRRRFKHRIDIGEDVLW